MKPITQTIIGVEGDGDCLMASLASILELTLDDLPTITKEQEAEWFRIFVQAARARGFYIMELPGDTGALDAIGDPVPALAPSGYAIGIGPSPRFQGTENHAVVTLDGHVIHDPHPTRTGIVRLDYFLVLVPILRSDRALDPATYESMATSAL